jgi:hypothetical protein
MRVFLILPFFVANTAAEKVTDIAPLPVEVARLSNCEFIPRD